VVELQSLRVLATVRARDRVGNVATTSKRLLLAPRR
jgi:hypothetical protein